MGTEMDILVCWRDWDSGDVVYQAMHQLTSRSLETLASHKQFLILPNRMHLSRLRSLELVTSQ